MTKDMTVGSPMKNIITFGIPLMLGNFFQQFYNMADTIIVGKFVGKNALSALGSVGSLSFLILGSIVGLCVGFAIPVSQAFGAGDETKIKKLVANIAYVCVFCAVIFTVGTVLALPTLLDILNIPREIRKDAYDYTIILFALLSATIFYNILASLMRALGDSKTPLYFLIFSSVLNIGLDIFFIVAFDWGVRGAAVATEISKVVSGVLCLIVIVKKFPILRVTEETRALDFECVKELLRNGLPMAFQTSITAVGSVMLSSCINNLGANSIAAMTIGSKIQLLLILPSEAIGLAMATYCGQNLGARKIKRITKGIRRASLLAVIYSAIAFILVRNIGSYVGLLFVNKGETAVLELAQQFLNTASWFYPFLALLFVFRNSLQGLGYSMTAMITGVFELVARAFGGFYFVNRYGWDAVCFMNPMAWVSAIVFLLPACTWALKRLKKRI